MNATLLMVSSFLRRIPFHSACDSDFVLARFPHLSREPLFDSE